MMLDLSRFPLVTIHQRNTTDVSPERQIEMMLDRNERFVIMMHNPEENNRDDTPEDRKSRSQFFKRNKGRLKTLCAAAIIIEGNKPVSGPIKAMAWALSKSFGVPFHFAADKNAGIKLAERYVLVA